MDSLQNIPFFSHNTNQSVLFVDKMSIIVTCMIFLYKFIFSNERIFNIAGLNAFLVKIGSWSGAGFSGILQGITHTLRIYLTNEPQSDRLLDF